METELLELNQEQLSSIAGNLEQLIKLRNTTDNKIAQDLNIPPITIKRLLSGETTDPRISTLKSISDYFNVSIDTLIEPNSIGPTIFINKFKPAFLPLLDWETAKNIGDIDFTHWENWVPVTLGKDVIFHQNAFALESRPSMYPRFQPGTIFILEPSLIPADGDLVLVNLRENNELTLRELSIDPPDWQLHPLNQGTGILNYSKDSHEIVAIVCLTLFYNRKMRPVNTER